MGDLVPEQRQDVLCVAIGDGESLDAQLLLDLKGLQDTLSGLGTDRGRRGKLILRVHEGDEVYDVEVTDMAPVGPGARQRFRVVPGVLNVLEQ